MSYKLKVIDSFASGHFLPKYKGKCENLHGHNFKVEVEVVGDQLDDGGLLIDFAELKAILGEILDAIDHKLLNDISPFDEISPSSENLARFLCEKLTEKLADNSVKVSSVTVWESEKACASYIP